MMLAVVPVTSLRVWLVLFVGMLLLTPLTRGSLRQWALAGVNALFLGLCLGGHALWVLAGAGGLYLLLRGLQRETRSTALVALLPTIMLALFALHKLPPLAESLRLTPLNPLLAGIGFSYVCLRVLDMYQAVRSGRHAAPTPLGLFNYVLPFHMLAAGPIQAYDDYAKQPAVPPRLTGGEALDAADRIAQGLFKKFVLAYLVQHLFCTGWRSEGWYLLFEINAHFFWLYLDFTAYTDIAVGFGKLLGVPTPENFNRPLLARNLNDFWDRWHMTFSQFLRRNLFVPIQMATMRRTGGRHALLSASVAVFITFVLCGAWHGLTAPFLLFGVMHATGLVACILYKEWLQRRFGVAWWKRYAAQPAIRVVNTIVTFEFVAISVRLIGDQWQIPW